VESDAKQGKRRSFCSHISFENAIQRKGCTEGGKVDASGAKQHFDPYFQARVFYQPIKIFAATSLFRFVFGPYVCSL
jgi:hypothetical protein